MARRTPYPGSGRLAAVLVSRPAPPASGVPAAPFDEPPTVPIPVQAIPPRQGRAGRRFTDRWLPRSWRDVRIDPGRPGALAVVLVGVLAAVVAAVGVWREAPRAEPVTDLPVQVTTSAAAAPSAVPAVEPETLVVAVAGKVRRPGLVRVEPGSRVADVLEAAGGPLPDADLSGVNLARKVGDGEQVAIGVPPAPDAGPVPATSGARQRPGRAARPERGHGRAARRSARGRPGHGAADRRVAHPQRPLRDGGPAPRGRGHRRAAARTAA